MNRIQFCKILSEKILCLRFILSNSGNTLNGSGRNS